MSANDGVDFSSPNSSFNQQEQPVTLFASSCTTSDVPTDDQSATSSTLEASNKIKNKKRQPKYRATKRPPSERRFQCDHCESRFFTQKDVKRHLVVHTGIRNFACPYCTQRFGRKDHLVRHAKKTHDQDTRSFKRRNRAQSLNASTSNPTESKKTRKSTARSKKKPEENFAAVQPNTCTTASTATVTTTSTSTSYYLHDNGFSSANRVAATSNPNFNNSTLMLSSPSTSNPFPKMTLVDHPSTSTLTASFTHSRNYPSSFNNFEHASPNFQYNANGTFNQFLPETSGTPYSAQLSSNSTYLNYDYKQPSSNANYTSNSQHDNFVNSSTDHLANVASNSNNISAFKSITSSIVDGFNTCIDLEYNNAGMNNFNAPISNAPFSESSHTSRFHTPFN